MAELKRQPCESMDLYNDPKKRMKQDHTNVIALSCTQLEDLSNEVLYEVFDFLEDQQLYTAFFNLNTRFNNVLIKSTLPIRVDLSSMSRLAFEQYRRDVLQPCADRIQLVSVSNPCLFHRGLAFQDDLSQFSRLETLVLLNIGIGDLESVLSRLVSLPGLLSLVLSWVGDSTNTNRIFLLIFRLRALKYCRISSEERYYESLLPPCTCECSLIEHLVIDIHIYTSEIDRFLAYLPRLRRLSLGLITQGSGPKTNSCSPTLDHLTDVSLSFSNVEIDQVFSIIADYCPNVNTLRISHSHDYQDECMDANRWQQFIESHLPNLRVFDVQFDFPTADPFLFQAKVDQFGSSFWLERCWFFVHRFCLTREKRSRFYFSTDPYRRKEYTLYRPSSLADRNDSGTKTILKSVDHLRIQHHRTKLTSTNYFPNVTKLTLDEKCGTYCQPITPVLNNLISLNRLTALLVSCVNFPLVKVIEILHVAPHLRTLELHYIPLHSGSSSTIARNKMFQRVSKTNIITKLTFRQQCSEKQLRIFLALCPRLQCLTVYALFKEAESRIPFLLDETNQNTKHLFCLCFLSANKNYYVISKRLIESKVLPEHCIAKLVDTEFYLWW